MTPRSLCGLVVYHSERHRLDRGSEVFLVLFATGVRGRSDLSAVRATIDGREIPVLFAGDQGFFLGSISLTSVRFHEI